MNAHAPIGAQVTDRFELVASDARLAEIAPAWDRLWAQGEGLVFQSHAWIATWWATVPARDRRELRIGLIWRGDELLAVLPLAIQRRRGLRFLEWAANDCSDYSDILLAPHCPPGALNRLWRLAVSAGRFDLYFLNRLRPTALFRATLDTADGLRLNANRRHEISSQVAGDWSTGAQWFESQSKKTRQNYRRGRKTLEETGKVVFRLLPPDEPVAPVLERLAELKRKWLVSHARESSLFDPDSPALPALVGILAETGVLRLFVLERDGVIIAVSVNFVQGNTLMAFLTSYDPDYERGSPGMVLLMDYIQWSIDQRLSMVDFLCGEEAFKQKFATTTTTLTSVMGAHTTVGHLAMLADNTRHALQSLMLARRSRPATAPVDA